MTSLYQTASNVGYRENVSFKNIVSEQSVEASDILVDNLSFANGTGNNLFVNFLQYTTATGTIINYVDEKVTNSFTQNLTGINNWFTNVTLKNASKNSIIWNNASGTLAGIPTGGNNTLLMTNNSGIYIWDGNSYLSSTNTIYGKSAGNSNIFDETSQTNVGVGTFAIRNTSSGGSNTAVGYNAGGAINSGSANTLIGTQVGQNITTADNNTFLGFQAGNSNSTTSNNTLLGASTDNPGGYSNSIGLGYQANLSASNQFMIGNSSLTNIEKNSSATVDIGRASNPFNTVWATNFTGTNFTIDNLPKQVLIFNNASGNLAGIATGGTNTVLLNNNAGSYVWTGKAQMTTNNTVLGNTAGSTGIYSDVLQRNTLIGVSAGGLLKASSDSSVVLLNTIVGNSAGGSLSGDDSKNNTFLGGQAGQNITGAVDCTFVGYLAGRGQTSQTHKREETYVGANAGLGVNSANSYFNTALGYSALSSITSATGNTAVGHVSMMNITSGSSNAGLGNSALRNITTGSRNVAVGGGAGHANTALTTGDDNIFIGHGASVDSNSSSNRIVIGSGAVNRNDNTIRLGNSSITSISSSATGTCDLGMSTKPFGAIYFKSLNCMTGSNTPSFGRVTLTSGSGTVSTTAVTANSNIYLTPQILSGTPGFVAIGGRIANTNFSVTSSSNTDTSTISYLLVEPVSI